jgi:hypothetical protein
LVEKLSSEPFSNNEELVKRVMKRYKYENNWLCFDSWIYVQRQLLWWNSRLWS